MLVAYTSKMYRALKPGVGVGRSGVCDVHRPNAPKVRALAKKRKVALTIDTDTQPPHVLLGRGAAGLEPRTEARPEARPGPRPQPRRLTVAHGNFVWIEPRAPST
jgi:hypothetical protein